MTVPTAEQLSQKKCVPCEGGVPKLTPAEVRSLLENVHGWVATEDGQRIRKEWTIKNFMAGIDFFNKVAEVAEQDGHHPDLHLAGYRHVTVELWTHAIGGLSENDFILAAKIDQIPLEVKL